MIVQIETYMTYSESVHGDKLEKLVLYTCSLIELLVRKPEDAVSARTASCSNRRANSAELTSVSRR